MKTLVTLMIVLFSMTLTAQDDVYGPIEKKSDAKNSPIGPKKTWKIVVKNDLSADENFNLVGRTLIENDYLIENKDKDFYTIKTTPSATDGNKAIIHFLYFVIKDKSIVVTGKSLVDVSFAISGVRRDDAFDKISNIGMKGSPARITYFAMHSFALKLGSDIEYIND